ncbi:hypothetical protein L6164_023371 [Bauhinia variegata]|uniref:Uncharacterized protein n=1 Tax=Bauhinia variegata TaxID=167791 RepID=A0ACB9MJD9_BAUVA|nr:hypothetical protein L6164_023371 [Bauhinia variegata]
MGCGIFEVLSMPDESCSIYIPEDIMVDIFSRLPVKSLIRFQSLSKDYAKLFKTTTFISEHLHCSHNNPSLLCITPRKPWKPYFIRSHETKEEIKKADRPMSSLSTGSVIGCCNGLICMYHSRNWSLEALSIWNPATKEFRRIEVPSFISWWACGGEGFGFSAILNDYKIVMHYRNEEQAVYSLSTDTWRGTRVENFLSIYNFGGNPALSANGALFWAGFEKVTSYKRCHCLISFDIDKEVFSKIKLPPGPDIDSEDLSLIQLALYKNSIAVLHETTNHERVDVWVRDEKSAIGECFTWVKLFTVGPFSSVLYAALAIWREEIVIYNWEEDSEDGVVLYHCSPSSNKLKKLPFQFFGGILHCFIYAESLVQINS